MATVIDELIVTLGLDPSNFTKGQKAAALALTKTEKDTTKAADNMGKAVTFAARQFAIAFLGFESAKGLVNTLARLNEMTRQLGFMGKNTNNSETELRNWANAADVAGASGKSLLATIQKIQAEQFAFRLGQPTEFYAIARRLGVSLVDPNTRKDRSQTDVLLDLSRKFADLTRTQGRPTANALGLKMGIDQDTMNFLLQGPARIGALLNEQRRSQFQVTPKQSQDAQALDSEFTRLKQHGEGALLAILSALRPSLEKLIEKLNSWLSNLDMNAIKVGFDKLVQGISDLVTVLGPIARWMAKQAGSALGAAADVLRDKALGETLMQSDPRLAKLLGRLDMHSEKYDRATNSTVRSFDYKTAKEVIDAAGLSGNDQASMQLYDLIYRATGKSETQQLSEADRKKVKQALEEWVTSAGKSSPLATTGALSTVQADRMASNSNRSTSSQTQIDSITINTAATDANNIAGSMRRAIERKLVVAQADGGLA